MKDDGDWRRQLMVGIGMLALAAVLVGGILGGAAVVAARFAGLGKTPGAEPAVTFPNRTPAAAGNTAPETSEPTTPEKPARQRPSAPILLNASPTVAAGFERITLQGRFHNASAAAITGTGRLQVQRRDGSTWLDFPVTASVHDDGTFSTYVQTARTGENRFRVVDPATGRASNPVVVTIR